MDLIALSELARSMWGAWLMLIFLGIVLWAFWPSRRRAVEAHADIPLREDR